MISYNPAAEARQGINNVEVNCPAMHVVAIVTVQNAASSPRRVEVRWQRAQTEQYPDTRSPDSCRSRGNYSVNVPVEHLLTVHAIVLRDGANNGGDFAATSLCRWRGSEPTQAQVYRALPGRAPQGVSAVHPRRPGSSFRLSKFSRRAPHPIVSVRSAPVTAFVPRAKRSDQALPTP